MVDDADKILKHLRICIENKVRSLFKMSYNIECEEIAGK